MPQVYAKWVARPSGYFSPRPVSHAQKPFLQPWTSIPSASAMSAWQWQESSQNDCCTHTPTPKVKTRWTEKSKQGKNFPGTSTKTENIKPWKLEIQNPCCWLLEYVWGIQNRL